VPNRAVFAEIHQTAFFFKAGAIAVVVGLLSECPRHTTDPSHWPKKRYAFHVRQAQKLLRRCQQPMLRIENRNLETTLGT